METRDQQLAFPKLAPLSRPWLSIRHQNVCVLSLCGSSFIIRGLTGCNLSCAHKFIHKMRSVAYNLCKLDRLVPCCMSIIISGPRFVLGVYFTRWDQRDSAPDKCFTKLVFVALPVYKSPAHKNPQLSIIYGFKSLNKHAYSRMRVASGVFGGTFWGKFLLRRQILSLAFRVHTTTCRLSDGTSKSCGGDIHRKYK